MTNPTPEREAEIRAWAAGSFQDGKPHIPEGVASFTRDLLAMLDVERATKEHARENAIEVAVRYGMIAGEHHKQWVIDQMIRSLLGDGYEEWAKGMGEDPDYEPWDAGVAP